MKTEVSSKEDLTPCLIDPMSDAVLLMGDPMSPLTPCLPFEPIPFSPEDFAAGGVLVDEIRRYGEEIV